MDNSEKSAAKGKFLIVDGNGLAYRSFYAVPVYKSALGLPINALCGFVKLLFNVISTEAPTHVAVAFDHSALTERLLRFQGYNVQREEMPNELAVQLPIIEDFVHACGIRTYRMPGFEADDCIGTIVHKAQAAGLRSLIISGDLELLQLVRPNVNVLTMRRGLGDTMVYNEETVKSMFRLAPHQLADLRALAGDSGQNIGGIPGIGNVTACRLLSQYNSLEELYSNLDSLPAKWRTPLRDNYEDAKDFLNRATIRTDLPLEFSLEDCRFSGIPIAMFARIFNLLGNDEFAFGPVLLERLRNMAIAEEPSLLPQQGLVGDEARQALMACRDGSGDLAVVWLANRRRECGIAISCAGQPIFYVSCENNTVSNREIWELLTPVFEDSSRRKYVFRSADMARRHSLTGKNVVDVALAAGLICPEIWDFSLESVCSRFGLVTYPSLLLFGDAKADWNDVPEQNKVCWAGRAANMLAVIGPMIVQALHERGLWDLFTSVDISFAQCMNRPVALPEQVDHQAVAEVCSVLDHEMAKLQDAICESAGYRLNVDDDRELGELLFAKLGLLVPTRPKAGEEIGADILGALEGQHAMVADIRRFRELSDFKKIAVRKLFSEGQLDFVIDGNLFNVALMAERRLLSLNKVAAGGSVLILHRLEAVVENLMVEAVRTPLYRAFQSLLFPERDRALAVVQLPQVFQRVLAHLAGDEQLEREADKGMLLRDLAQAVLGVSAENVSFRDLHTVTVMLYRYMGPQWLSRRMGCSFEQAEAMLQAFDAELARRFPQSWQFMCRELEKARNHESLVTLAGRSWVPVEVSSRMLGVRVMAERSAMTYAVEGAVTDIQRLACSRIGEEFGSSIRMLPLFDGIIISAPSEQLEAVMEKAVALGRESCYGLKLPIAWHRVGSLAEAIADLGAS
ncbi:hypothetical protein IJT17_05120 [bacterium]|nr:hypothetical protein [bacterium]